MSSNSKNLFRFDSKSLICLSFLGLIWMVSCNDKATFNVREDGRPGQDNSESTSSNEDIEIDESGNGNADWELKIVSADQKKSPDDRAQVVFVLDNSPSMSDNIQSLALSIPQLFEKLDAAKLPYSTRLLTIDMLDKQLAAASNFVAPVNMTGSSLVNFDRGNLNNIYNGVLSLTGVQSGPAAKSALNSIANNPVLFDNEPGVCLAMDYLNWSQRSPSASASAKFSPTDRVHFVVLSDEENARKYNTHDRYTYAVTSSKDLVCYRDYSSSQECHQQKFDRYLTFQSYCYAYKVPKYSYRHTGSYDVKGQCHTQGHSNGSTDLTLKKLSSNKYCATNSYSCSKQLEIPRWSCNLDSQQPQYFQDNKNGLKSCKQAKQFKCNETQTRYQCQTSNGSPQVTRSTPVGSGIKSCEVAQKFECKQIYDSQPFWVETERATALSVMSQHGASWCRVSQTNPSWTFQDVPTAEQSNAGVRSCASYSCSPEDIVVEVTRPRGDPQINSNSCSVIAAASNWEWADFESSASGDHIDAASCQSYSCNSDPLQQTVSAQRLEHERDGWTCDAQPSNVNADMKRVFAADLDSGNSNSLLGVLTLACDSLPGSYRMVNGINYDLSSARFCPTNVSNIPADVSVTDSGVSPRTQVGLPFNVVSSSQKSQQTMINGIQATIPYSTVSIHMNGSTPDFSAVAFRNGQYDNVTDDCYTFQKYPEGNAFRNEVEDLTETYANYNNVKDDGSFLIPPAHKRDAGHPVVENRVDNSSGRYSEQVCGATQVKEKRVLPAPDQFDSFIHETYPKLSYMWHSIVTTKTGGCGLGADLGSSVGKDYMDLSNQTDGIISDICQTNFDPFIKALTEKVITEVVVSYALPAEFAKKRPIMVKNKNTNEVLKFERDYWVAEGHIIFDRRKISKDDDLLITF